LAAKNNFKIAEEIKVTRGIQALEQQEELERFNRAVEERVKVLRSQVFKEAFVEGQREGKEDALKLMMAEVENNLTILKKILGDLIQNYAQIVEEQKVEIIMLIKNLVQWIILKEIDESYITRLLEKLILELKTKSNLVIQINKENFGSIPELLKEVEKSVGTLTNVRIEEFMDVEKFGLIVKSDNGIINANLSGQFAVLDKVFGNNG
jgi:flagellar biosynthesis/type III secretory pathway protein FliH